MFINSSILSKFKFFNEKLISKIITLNKIILSKIFNIEIIIYRKSRIQINYEKICSNKNSYQKEVELEKISNLPEYKELKPYILYELLFVCKQIAYSSGER